MSAIEKLRKKVNPTDLEFCVLVADDKGTLGLTVIDAAAELAAMQERIKTLEELANDMNVLIKLRGRDKVLSAVEIEIMNRAASVLKSKYPA